MSTKDQNRFFKILNEAADRRDREEDVYQYDPLQEDHVPFGQAAFQSEIMEVEAIPERTAVAPFLKNPESENTEFIMVLADVLQTNPKMIDFLSKSKTKLSSEMIPDPEGEKPFRSDSTREWEKAVKSYILKKEKETTSMARAVQSRRRQNG